jgi:nitronate monooxygenase
MKTRITELLGIQYPIICGGMLWVCGPELCAAVSNAGGLGCITAANYNSGEELRSAIRKARELTSNPIGVNITLLPSFRITSEMYDDYFRICCEEKVAHIEIAGNFADKYIPMVHEAGVKISHKVGALRHALAIEKRGYDAVFAAGIEEGGHPLNDDVATTVLTPRIADHVKIPVVTTGGISDGRGLAAALALGADGVMMASRFLATEECTVHQAIKAELVRRQENDTQLICKTIGLQGRTLKTDLTNKIVQIECSGGGLDDLKDYLNGQRLKVALASGDVQDAALYVGQSIGLIHEIKTCKEVIEGMVAEAKDILQAALRKFD